MMVIGSVFFRQWVTPAFLIVLALTLPALRSVADDQIIKKDGTTVNGTILSVSDGQVLIESHASNGGVAKFPITITDIKSVDMATPAEVTKVQGEGVTPAAVIAALEPQVKQFAGLPTNWVVAAMAQLGDAYADAGQLDKALAAYNQISQLYPGSAYINVAQAGRAKLSFKAGKIDEALATVQPIVDQANKDIAPSPADGALYANAFLVYGQVLEAQKKPQQALEAYLTVKTMFYQNAALADQADQLAKNLKDKNPGLGID
jgi:tetratricopeptide (TPR) repeat protein